VNLSIDGGGTTYSSSGSTTSVTLAANGTATYTANFATAGVHTIVALYAGDSTHAASSGSVSINIAAVSSGKGTFAFALAPSTLTISQGSQGTETLTITPSGGYTGTVDLSFDTSNDNALTNLCVFSGTGLNSSGNAVISSATPVAAQLQFDTNASDCASAAVAKSGKHALHRLGLVKTSQNNPPNRAPFALAFAGLLFAGFMGRSSRKLRNLAAVIGLLAIGLGLSACGGSSVSTTTVSDPPKGTYTITVIGQDSATTTITATQSFTLVID
jgi:hypothetical protein